MSHRSVSNSPDYGTYCIKPLRRIYFCFEMAYQATKADLVSKGFKSWSGFKNVLLFVSILVTSKDNIQLWCHNRAAES